MPVEPSERTAMIPIVKREERVPFKQGKKQKQQKREKDKGKDKGKDKERKVDIRV